ncbi:maltokinase N-terminal cap-like domain-containing protein [Cryptosporangium phraense]|uniref:1,4-alpha-glucan branching protein n=1 Tax=Cryptosporangium phraense TaxID=2593070 RepID=A0A545AIG5_9ACTN|nr:1,4-alpha-glucan branching protein [Cryptosporangium phraense]TQS41109.1 1,4-alpha-glucan branching protein [Cryptosporangium phraense]
MATVHDTTLVPSKLELLAVWIPRQPWYGGAGDPELRKAGGFRLDDPAGEVGIELMVVVDVRGPETGSYLVPMTYRSEPLPGADGALIGTMEHGVLGKRYAYDAPHDPVFRECLLALVHGKAVPQAQSRSDTVDTSVRVVAVPDAVGADIVRVLTPTGAAPAAGEVSVPYTLADEPVRAVVARAI